MEEQQPIADNYMMLLPEEVMYRHLFPFLKFRDLLRLRRVSKILKRFSDGYIRNNFSENEREINEMDHTIADFISRNLPSSHIYLNNSGPDFFENPSMAKFLQMYATKITHLRVNHFSTCISEAEDNFFCALTNLQHLELMYTDARKRSCLNSYKMVNGQKVFREKCYFPPNFRNLKTLKLNEIVGSERFDQGYAWDFIEFCTQLEHLKHPLYRNMIEGTCDFADGPFGCVIQCIKKWLAETPDIPISLKSYDFDHHEEHAHNYFGYLNFVLLCYQHKIKILNLDASLHDMVLTAFEDNYEQFTEPLVSVKNVHAAMFEPGLEFPNLEKVVIKSIKRSSFQNYGGEEDPELWPNLKILDINIDSDETQDIEGEVESLPTTEFFEFLFEDQKRDKLKDLTLRYPKEASRRNTSSLPVPRVVEIVTTCPNVTRLTLSNWIGTNKAVSLFWNDLLHLEEVVLDECKMLGDVAFVGKDRENPSFLKLAKLQKLELRGLDEMPKLTDLLFNLVFRHLKIKEFKLSSNKPIKSITINGFRSLLSGEFNNSVEKFPFDTWSLENVSMEDFIQLK